MVAPSRTAEEIPGRTHVIGSQGGRILVGVGLLDECAGELRATPGFGGRRVAIISDDVVAPLYAARVAAACTSGGARDPLLFTVAAGEASKTRDCWSRLTDEMLAAGFGRDSAIVGLGGGVIGDLAGFVAATFMRGIPVIQVPTTLLAMIDASIGGKTGVNTGAGKNLVGAFHHPLLVLADPGALRTLPALHLRGGLAEAIKLGVVASPAEFAWIAANAVAFSQDGGPGDELAVELVRRNIELKASIVSRDEREEGMRKILNFGHTIGHAIEALSGYTMVHGECVAIGMVAEARIAARVGIGDADLADLIARVLDAAGLPAGLPRTITPAAVLAATRSDKKARGGAVEYALPVRIGLMAAADRGYGIPVPDALVLETLAALRR
ncbi:MAG TPA: 3-dehydroquinate synthase [Gemmatimonadaceae bacterium]|nr:3-dehydroquinate synthase [Gemmatimonadaceae bacterium]